MQSQVNCYFDSQAELSLTLQFKTAQFTMFSTYTMHWKGVFKPTSLRNSNFDAESLGFSAPGGYAMFPIELFPVEHFASF